MVPWVKEQPAEGTQPSLFCCLPSVLLLATELTQMRVSLSMEGTRGRHPSLETSENTDSLALVVVGAGDYRACIHLAT